MTKSTLKTSAPGTAGQKLSKVLLDDTLLQVMSMMKITQWFSMLMPLYLCQIQAGMIEEAFWSSGLLYPDILQLKKTATLATKPCTMHLFRLVRQDKNNTYLDLSPELFSRPDVHIAEGLVAHVDSRFLPTLDNRIRQHGGGQSRSQNQSKDAKNGQTTQSSLSTPDRFLQSTTVSRSTRIAGAGDDGDDDPDPARNRRETDDADKARLELGQETLATFLKFLLQSIDQETLESLANDLERHLAVCGQYGQEGTPTLNVRLHRAITHLGLVVTEWHDVLEYLHAHPAQIECFVQTLGQRNRTILRASMDRLSEPEESTVTMSRKASCSRLIAKRRFISLPNLLAVNTELEPSNPTLTFSLYPLLQKKLPNRSGWRWGASVQQVLQLLGHVFEELPADYRYQFWRALMQALALPETLDFEHYRNGLAQRINAFMTTRRGSRLRLARALAETLPIRTVNNMILGLAQLTSCQNEENGEQPVVGEEGALCPVSEGDEAGLEDLLKKLRVVMSDDELLEQLLKFMQPKRCLLDMDNLDVVFSQEINIPFAADRWRQALRLLRDSPDTTRLSEFVLALNRHNRACLAWGLSTLNHLSHRLSELVQVQTFGDEISRNNDNSDSTLTQEDVYESIPLDEDEYVSMMPLEVPLQTELGSLDRL